MVARSDRATGSVEPAVIHPNAVYSLPQAARALGLAKNCLPREARLGRLRVSKRAGRYYTTGAWLMEWIESGERRSRRPTPGGGEEGR